MAPNKKASGLGKGLDALIATNARVTNIEQSGVLELDINKIDPNPNQPRKNFEEASLIELASSLQEFGMIQPMIVSEENGYYTIVAGERRWRAARIAKFKTVPVIVKNYSQLEMLQIALVENIQRKDLNPIEEALCYKRLVDEFFFTQTDLAEKVGKSRNVISYSISLLNLDLRVQNFVIEGKISPGHGRVLLNLEDNDMQFEFAERAIEEGLSIAVLEKMIAYYKENTTPEESETVKKDIMKNSNVYTHIEKDLKNILGTPVYIKDGKNKGKIEIEYHSNDELDRLLGLFKKID